MLVWGSVALQAICSRPCVACKVFGIIRDVLQRAAGVGMRMSKDLMKYVPGPQVYVK